MDEDLLNKRENSKDCILKYGDRMRGNRSSICTSGSRFSSAIQLELKVRIGKVVSVDSFYQALTIHYRILRF